MPSRLIHLALAVTLAVVTAQDCNICGDGNSIQFPTGVVRFEFKGQQWKNNCKELQEIVKNPVAISDKFCRNELLSYTVDICRCTDAQGELVRTYYQAPTTSPAPDGPPADTAVASNEEKDKDEFSLGVAWAQRAVWSLGLVVLVSLAC